MGTPPGGGGGGGGGREAAGGGGEENEKQEKPPAPPSGQFRVSSLRLAFMGRGREGKKLKLKGAEAALSPVAVKDGPPPLLNFPTQPKKRPKPDKATPRHLQPASTSTESYLRRLFIPPPLWRRRLSAGFPTDRPAWLGFSSSLHPALCLAALVG